MEISGLISQLIIQIAKLLVKFAIEFTSLIKHYKVDKMSCNLHHDPGGRRKATFT